MRVLPLLVLLCAVVLSVEASYPKCKHFGQLCQKGRNCISGLSKPGLACRSRKLLGGCAKLCRFGGKWCPDGKVCRNTKVGRRCIWGTHKVFKCKSVGQRCAKGRKCIPCYLRGGLCCRRASLLGKKKYCGLRYKVYGKRCGKKYYGKKYIKKSCWAYGTYCADGKSCRKVKGGRRVCVFKKKLRGCRDFGQICGWKNNRNCVPCYNRKGLCCRRRSKLASCAKHCRYGGKWCPDKKTCRQKIIKGVVTRRCVYIPRCKHYGQTCGQYGRQVCLRCYKNKLCCRKGVTKGQCKKRCRAFWLKCSLKGCRKGSKGWCCKPRRVTKAQCLKRCRGLWKYCSVKGCPKRYLGYCCKTKPYITKKKCQVKCRGPWRYCSTKGCPKGFRGYCCKTKPYVHQKQCQKKCRGLWRYCSKKGCPKGFRGYCCKTKPYVNAKQCQKKCRGLWRYCSKKGCPKGFRGYCCKTKPYVNQKQCQKTCKGLYKYCSKKGCLKGFRGYCCKIKPYVHQKQCQKKCKGPWRYCSKKGCRKGFRGYCCKNKPYVSRDMCKKTCKGKYEYCTAKGCPKGVRGYCCLKQGKKGCKGKKYCG